MENATQYPGTPTEAARGLVQLAIIEAPGGKFEDHEKGIVSRLRQYYGLQSTGSINRPLQRALATLESEAIIRRQRSGSGSRRSRSVAIWLVNPPSPPAVQALRDAREQMLARLREERPGPRSVRAPTTTRLDKADRAFDT